VTGTEAQWVEESDPHVCLIAVLSMVAVAVVFLRSAS